MLCNMTEICKPTLTHHFAIPAFNTGTSMVLRACIEAAEEANAPVIVEIHPDELRFARKSFAKMVIEEAHNTKIPVCLHLDHGANLEDVMTAIACGFTSVMIDGSALPFEENIAQTRKVVEIAHAVGVSV